MSFFKKALNTVKDIGRTVVNTVASPVTTVVGKGPLIKADKFENEKFGKLSTKATTILGGVGAAALTAVGVGKVAGVLGKGVASVKGSGGKAIAAGSVSQSPKIPAIDLLKSTGQVVRDQVITDATKKLLPGVLTPNDPLAGGAPKANGAVASLLTGVFSANNPVQTLAPPLANSPAVTTGGAVGIAQNHNPIISPFQIIGENLANDKSIQAMTGEERSDNATLQAAVMKSPMNIVFIAGGLLLVLFLLKKR